MARRQTSLKLVNFNAERLNISQNDSGKGDLPVALPLPSLGSVTTMSSSFPYTRQLGPSSWFYPEDRTNVLNAIAELTVHPVAKKPKIKTQTETMFVQRTAFTHLVISISSRKELQRRKQAEWQLNR